MKPSIGRVVHYVAYGTPGGEYAVGAHRAAIVTEVREGPDYTDGTKGVSEVKLFIMNPTGVFFSDWLREDPSGKWAGSWHWPEREE